MVQIKILVSSLATIKIESWLILFNNNMRFITQIFNDIVRNIPINQLSIQLIHKRFNQFTPTYTSVQIRLDKVSYETSEG